MNRPVEDLLLPNLDWFRRHQGVFNAFFLAAAVPNLKREVERVKPVLVRKKGGYTLA